MTMLTFTLASVACVVVALLVCVFAEHQFRVARAVQSDFDASDVARAAKARGMDVTLGPLGRLIARDRFGTSVVTAVDVEEIEREIGALEASLHEKRLALSKLRGRIRESGAPQDLGDAVLPSSS